MKIADFGLARELQGGIKEIKLDKNQRLPIKWLSPETVSFSDKKAILKN